MLKLILICCLLVAPFSTPLAGNTYIVSYADRSLIKVAPNGKETTLRLPYDPEVVVTTENQAYLLTSFYPTEPINPLKPNTIKRTLSAVDLTNLSVSGEVTLNHEATAMTLTETHAYVANYSGESISIHNLKNLADSKELKVGKLPIGVEIKNGLIYVLCQESKSIHVLHKETNKTLYKLDLGSVPLSFKFTETHIYVLTTDDTLILVDLKDHQVSDCLKVGKRPSSLTLCRKIGLVTNEGDNTVSVIDLESNTNIKTIKVGTKPIKIAVDCFFAYVLNQEDPSITTLDLVDGEVIAHHRLGHPATDIDLSPTHIYIDGRRTRPKYPHPFYLPTLLNHHQLVDYVDYAPLFKALNAPQVLARTKEGDLSTPLTDKDALDRLVLNCFPKANLLHASPEGQIRLLTLMCMHLYINQTAYARVALRGLIELGNPYACALAVLAYRHGLLDAPIDHSAEKRYLSYAHGPTITYGEKSIPGFYETAATYLKTTVGLAYELLIKR